MRKFLKFILTFVLFVLITILCLSFSLKEVVIDTLSKEVVSGKIVEEVTDLIRNYVGDDYSTLHKLEENIKNSDAIYNITNEYIDSITKDVISNNDIKNIDANKYIEKIIDENKEVLEENGVHITKDNLEKIKEELDNNKLDNIYVNVVNNVKNNITKEEKGFIRMYNKFITPSFRFIIFICIIITIILIAFIKKTYYRWMYNLSIALILSGIILSFVSSLVTDFIKGLISYKTSLITNINLNSIVSFGYICFLLSFLFIIIYFICLKIENKNMVDKS